MNEVQRAALNAVMEELLSTQATITDALVACKLQEDYGVEMSPEEIVAEWQRQYEQEPWRWRARHP
jgi:hypothetical protein